jgi:hypothetical protein
MATLPVKDIAASVRARLLNIARESGRDFDAEAEIKGRVSTSDNVKS